jgi:hypothetical protein
MYTPGMYTIELTADELRLVETALKAYLDDFGHEEADILRQIKALLAKLRAED